MSDYAYDDEQCPERGPALNHTMDGPPVCVFCGTRLRSAKNRPLLDHSDPNRHQVPFAHNAQWTVTGACFICSVTSPLRQGEEGFVHAPDTLVEPRAIELDDNGKRVGPRGPLRGAEKVGPAAFGRLPMTVEDEKRLLFFIGWVRDGHQDDMDAGAAETERLHGGTQAG